MAKSWAKLAGAGACVALVLAVALWRNELSSAAPRPDLKPVAHWVFDGDAVSGKTVADRCGKLSGTLLGAPVVESKGPTPHLHLTGPDDGVMVKPRVAPDAEYLPKEALSIVAWVRVDEPAEWGAFLGCFQDNGPSEFGFVTGFNKKKFFFGLATTSAKKLTYLESKTEYVRGKWYHVAATYVARRCASTSTGNSTPPAPSSPGRCGMRSPRRW